MLFQLGDRVEAFGVLGTVVESWDEVFTINVKFDNGHFCLFTEDGRAGLWHKTASLKRAT